MKKYIVHIKFIVLFLVLIFLYSFAAKRNNLKKVNKINVEFSNGKNLFITYDSVNKLLIQKLKKQKNISTDSLHLNNLEDFINSNKMIQNAEVYTTINNNLGAIITQRMPIIRVINGYQSYYLDEFGKKMPLSGNYSARVPILTSEVYENSRKDIVFLANKIKNDSFLKKQIVGIDYIKKDSINQFNLRTRLGNQIIVFGTIHNFERKKNKLKAFYQKAIKDSSLEKFDTINLKYRNQVVCSKK